MTDMTSPTVEIDTSRRAALEREAALLERSRERLSFWCFTFLVLGAACLGIGFYVLARQPLQWAFWPSTALAAVLWGLAAVTEALFRGRNPAWGFLPFVGFTVLLFLKDRNLQRLDEIEGTITGRTGSRAIEEYLSLNSYVPFWGLYQALRRLRETRRQELAPPSEAIWFGTASTLVAVVAVVYFSWPRATDEVAYGKQAVVRLPPGWVEFSEEIVEISQDDPGFQVAVASRKTPAAVTVSLVPKPPGMDIDEFAKGYSAERLRVLGPTFLRSNPNVRTVGSRRLIEYQFHGPAERKAESEQLLTFWETPQFFWVTMAWTSQEGFRRIGHELRLISESVYSTE